MNLRICDSGLKRAEQAFALMAPIKVATRRFPEFMSA